MTDDDELPRDHEAERLTLGCIIAFPDGAPDVFSKLHERDFFDPAHKAIYAAMLDQRSRGLSVDPPLLAAELKHHPAFEGGDNPGYEMMKMAEEVVTVAHVEHYAGRVRDASRKRYLRSIGETLVEGTANGKAPDDILSALRADLYEYERETSSVEQREKFTFSELRELHPRLNPPVIDGLFRSGETVNIISVSKVGKSWLAYNLALCTIVGRKWLDRFETAPGRVLLIDNELHKCTVAHRIPVVADALSIPREHYDDDLEVWSLRGKLRSLQQLTPDIMELEPDEFRLLLLDAKYRFATPSKSENDNAAETAEYNLLDQWAEHTGAAIAIIHHSSKGSQSDKRVTDVGAGAGAQSRAADCHIILREHEEPDIVVLDAAVRSFPPVEPLALRWTFPLWVPAADVDPTQLKRQPTGNEQRQNTKDRQAVNQIIKALRDGPATPRALRPKTGLSRDRQQRLLDWMESKGHVTGSDTTVRGNPTREYTLVTSPD